MSGSSASYDWMATLLELLFERYQQADALVLLQDIGTRERALQELTPDLESIGMPPGMLVSPEGQNLFVAVLSLRLKFPVDEARHKVALNIAMREGRGPSRS